MHARSLFRTVMVVACVAASVSGAGAGAAGAVPPPRHLVATAASPGVAAPQTVSIDLRRYLRSTNARFLRSPSADTAVVAVPDIGYGLRHGRPVRRKLTPCVAFRITLSLHLGQPDPLRVATDLVPQATTMEYNAEAAAGALGVGSPPEVYVLRADDRATKRAGDRRTATEVMDWSHRGRHGFSAITATGTTLRVTGHCAEDRGEWSLEELLTGTSRVAGGA